MSDARLLFLVSNDYGELSNALYLLRGTALDATLLLPERLFELNRDALPVRTRCYRTLSDVIEVLEGEQPDLVCLFSAYLYAINGILELAEVEALLDELRRRRVVAMTTDPFLGLLSQAGSSIFSERHPQRQWLADHFARLAGMLLHVEHLYLVPADHLSGERKISVFNPEILSAAASQPRLRASIASRLPIDPERPRWLFLLASEDYGAQVARLGQQTFEVLLSDRLEDAVRAGRQPLLIAPSPCVDSLSRSGRALPGLISLSFCAHELFTDLLLEAEYAFYWNVLSNSLLARVANRLPALFFDRGHLAHAVPALLELGLKTYFPAAQLTLLDQRHELRIETLAALAAAQEAELDQARSNFLRSLEPRELVERLLAARPT